MDNNSIKENIRKVRKAKKLTQEEMANLLDISLTAYRDLERGSTGILNSNIRRIAEITGTTEEELVLGYLPEQADNSRINENHIEYGNLLEKLQTRIRDLEKLVESLEEIIKSKNEIIIMLKKNID